LSLFGQNDSIPYYLTKKYFNRELKNYKSYLKGEAKEQNFNPKEISEDSKIQYEILSLDDTEAVIEITITADGNSNNLYAFWTKEQDWKIKAFRALWLPGFFYSMLEEYKDLDEVGIRKVYDNKIAEAKVKNDTISEQELVEVFGTIEDFQFEIENMKLTVAPDEKLIKHFNQNKEKFNILLSKIKSDTLTNSNMWRFDNKSNYKIYMHEILVSSISNYDDNKLTSFVIGGMIDNTVGYFYCENPKDVPKMSDNWFIMIKNIGDGWYLYKTT